MKKLYTFATFLMFSTAVRAQSTTDSIDLKFNKLLDETGMVFKMPEGSVKAPIVKNRQILYEYAVNYPSRNLEVRYTVVPMGKRIVEYQEFQKKHEPGSSMIDPNKMFDASCYATAINAGGGVQDTAIKVGKIPDQVLKNSFKADQGTFWMIPIKNNSFGTDYKFCSMMALQKDNVANIYIFYLCNSLQELGNNIREIGAQNIYYAFTFKQ